MDTQRVVDTLNELILESEHRMKRFFNAADRISETILRSELHARAQQCGQAVEELQGVVRMLGSTPCIDTLPEAREQGEKAERAEVAASDIAVLCELERSEEQAIGMYTDALQRGLPTPIKTVVEDQFQALVGNHQRVRTLRDGFTRVN